MFVALAASRLVVLLALLAGISLQIVTIITGKPIALRVLPTRLRRRVPLTPGDVRLQAASILLLLAVVSASTLAVPPLSLVGAPGQPPDVYASAVVVIGMFGSLVCAFGFVIAAVLLITHVRYRDVREPNSPAGSAVRRTAAPTETPN